MLYAIVAVIALIIDQAVKYWTTVNIVVDTGEAKLIPGFVHLANVHNTGAAFSFLQGARWFFVILCIIFVLIVIYALAKDLLSNRLSRWMAVFVMAGAIGNCIDRIVCGYVVDMFEFDFLIFKHRFPVFNVADIYITLGVIVFCICILLEKPKKSKREKTPKRTNVNHSTTTNSPTEADKKIVLQRHRHNTERTSSPASTKTVSASTDSGNPFAEWEQEPLQTTNATVTTVDMNFSQPNSEEKSQQNLDPTISSDIPKMEPVRKEEPSHIQPIVEKATAPNDNSFSSAEDEEVFNLDDILAEFRDE